MPRATATAAAGPVETLRELPDVFHVITFDDWAGLRRVSLPPAGVVTGRLMPFGRDGQPRRGTARILLPGEGITFARVASVRLVESVPRLEGTTTEYAISGADESAPLVTVGRLSGPNFDPASEPVRWTVTAWAADGRMVESAGVPVRFGGCGAFDHVCAVCRDHAEWMAEHYVRYGRFPARGAR